MRSDDLFVANAYRQDFPVPGFTSQATAILDVNREGKGNLPPLNVRMSQAVTPSKSDGSTE